MKFIMYDTANLQIEGTSEVLDNLLSAVGFVMSAPNVLKKFSAYSSTNEDPCPQLRLALSRTPGKRAGRDLY